MPTDIDALIAKGLAMKQAGQSGRQVAEMLDREGVPPGPRRFILHDIANGHSPLDGIPLCFGHQERVFKLNKIFGSGF